MTSPFRALLLSTAVLTAGCDGARRDPAGAPAATSPTHWVSVGGRKFDVGIVAKERDRRHALTFLPAATESAGHLLAWPRARFMKLEPERALASFDAVFLDPAGRVVETARLSKGDLEGVMPKVEAAYVWLVPEGAAATLGAKPGVKIELSPGVLAAKPEELPVVRIGAVEARAELALTEPERQHGLMFRPRMSANDGMLFAYTVDGARSFWMSNTLIPLDIAFFANDGTFLNVVEIPPYPDPRNPPTPYPTADSAHPARYVLEMNVGWFRKHGLVDSRGLPAPGTKAVIPPEAARGAFE